MEWLYLPTGAAALALLGWRFGGRKNVGDSHGSATWARSFDLFRTGAFRKGGIRVGDIAGRKSVYYRGPHAATIGASGSGKGATAVVPTMLERNYIFLIDPGGENTAIAAKRWRDAGYSFACINPMGVFGQAPWSLPVHGFNPFSLLDPKSAGFLADAAMMAQMLTPRHGSESATAEYFNTTAQAFVTALIVHIMTAEPPARRHPGTLYLYLARDHENWMKLLRAMQRNEAFGGIAAHAANKQLRSEIMAPEEASGVLSTIEKNLAFLADPNMREFLSRNDVDFSALKGLNAGAKGAVISVILPLKYLKSHAAVQRLGIACAMKTLLSEPLAKANVLMVLDEAASLGRLEELPDWLATLRKFNVSVWSIWQSLGQLKEHYPKSWEVILGNCDMKQLLSVGDNETAKYFEELIGRATVQTASRNARGEASFSVTGRPLRFSDELIRLPEGKQVVFLGNEAPATLTKTGYWERPEFAGRYYDNPYRDSPTRAPGLGDQLAKLYGDIFGVLVWWLAPSRFAAFLYCGVAAGLIAYAAFFGGGG